MSLKFTKMHGLGNDYIYFNCFDEDTRKQIKDPAHLSIKLSNRHTGVGGDGIILICPSSTSDACMRMFNADGSEGKMCGNGIRCVGKYVYDNIIKKEDITIETLSGVKNLKIHVKNGKVYNITVDMGKPILKAFKIPVITDKAELIGETVCIDSVNYKVTCVSMGNPHCIVFSDDIDNINLHDIGPKFENNRMFPQGVNTEFVEFVDDNIIKMRVWERGSSETQACGTGACASVVACVENGIFPKNKDITVRLLGGELLIKYTDDTVYMTGTAQKVFDGVIDEERI